jgi:hypothetical protein
MTTAPFPENLSGYLVAFLHEQPSELPSCDSLSLKSRIHKNWHAYAYTSHRALLGENERGVLGPYKYFMACFRSGRKLLLLSENRRVVEAFLLNESKQFGGGLQQMEVDVDGFVKKTLAQPDAVYKMSYAYAHIPRYGAALNAASFYGDDLFEAALFREHYQGMTFYSCGLRLLIDNVEIARVRSVGRVSFFVPR